MPSFFHAKWTVLVLLAVAGWLGVSALKVSVQREQADKEVTNLEARITALEKENERLARLTSTSYSDAFLEKEARLKLNYKAPDEQVFFIYRDTDERKAPVQKEPESVSTYESIWNWVRGLFR